MAQGLCDRGITVVTFNFPYVDAGRRAPDRGPVLETFIGELWSSVVEERNAPLFVGGKSMGGRIASQAAAKALFTPTPAGLVFFGYPLHPPGKPEQRRDKHLPGVGTPMLFLHGSRDPFGGPDEMTTLVDGLDRTTLHLVDGGDHSLVARKRDDPAGTSLERAMDMAAEWIRDAGKRK